MIRHLEHIGGTEFHFKAIEAWVEIGRAGYHDGRSLSISFDDRVSAIVSKTGEIEALIAWRPVRWNLEAFISIGWVAPAKRRKGLYSKLYRSVKVQARKAGLRVISGGVSPENKAMTAAAKKQGRRLEALTFTETL
jgi:RimJ/RimL family protein N-acetyltransferase